MATPLKGHPYHEKSDAELHYILKDAGEAARVQKGMSSESKYLDQVNDAATVLAHRKRKAGKIKEAEELMELTGKGQLDNIRMDLQADARKTGKVTPKLKQANRLYTARIHLDHGNARRKDAEMHLKFAKDDIAKGRDLLKKKDEEVEEIDEKYLVGKNTDGRKRNWKKPVLTKEDEDAIARSAEDLLDSVVADVFADVPNAVTYKELMDLHIAAIRDARKADVARHMFAYNLNKDTENDEG